ncbi:hypothetical protein [Stenotrophomonas sp.]|uniref:head-tail joining protein n=1 Tax=Stenotrophomonas sp. TaxID=69392 RepID=UPI00289AD47B|nr:hypothetical protein [Stenotrophomonas sp.]
MSQREFLADLDATLHAGLAVAGMADTGQYTPPGGGASVLCQVYVDRDVETIGGLRQFVANRVEIAYVRHAGFAPAKDGTVIVDGATFTNAKIVSDDGSLSRWMVRSGS